MSRRRLFQLGSGVAAAALLPHRPVWAAGGEPTSLTADEALALLKQGNADFVADRFSPPVSNHLDRLAMAAKQTPFCAVLGCADSRVPPELLFGRRSGELFTVRVAGNVYDSVALGSLEYAVAVVKVPLILVLGHQNCGAVSAAMDVVENGTIYPGSINDVVEPIIPSVLLAKKQKGDLLDNAIAENVRRVESRLRHSEPMIAEPVAAGKLRLASARG
jgi:carbonic anhydrase